MKFTPALFAKTALATSLAVVLLHPEDASACAADPLTGSVCYMVTDFCPQGYLPAQGQVVSINAYQAQGTFGIPDLRGRSLIGVAQGPGLSTITRGQTPGGRNSYAHHREPCCAHPCRHQGATDCR